MARTKTTAVTLAPLWRHIPVTALPEAPGVEADADLTADVQAHGITDPLYIAPLAEGTYRLIDGGRRLAAARAAGLEMVPATLRPLIRITELAAHPGNVRTHLALSRAFLANIEQFGIRTPVKITPSGRVIDGHRRLAAAAKLGYSHIPYEYDEVGEADQYADMVTTARHREGLTLAEEASALFHMSELGASAAQMAAAAGVTQKRAKTMVKVAGTQAATVEGLDLEAAARLAAVEEADPDLFAQTVSTISESRYSATYHVQRAEGILKARESRAKHLAKLEKAGARICTLEELGKKAAPVIELADVSRPEAHAKCQGDAWVAESDDATRYTRYCTNTLIFGHDARNGVSPEERKRVQSGNAAWDAATTARRQWITTLISRKHTAAERDTFLRIAVNAQLTGNGVLAKKRGVDRRAVLLGEFLGVTLAPGGDEETHPAILSGRYMTAVSARLEKAAAAKRPAYLFADYAACHELEIPRHVWRADYRPSHPEEIYTVQAHRRLAAEYLTLLHGFGYQPTPVEAAVIAGQDYDPASPTPDDE
ncbi:ParB/RepB/Spo0J family partition protein [Streptomyces sp. NPDC005900]|uniref:ParB/RepB/Spo0J family partition protein n=1 Tax=Streptomyces sp. NPDC005900 TaxID=3154569 RepID=UPI003407922A